MWEAAARSSCHAFSAVMDCILECDQADPSSLKSPLQASVTATWEWTDTSPIGQGFEESYIS